MAKFNLSKLHETYQDKFIIDLASIFQDSVKEITDLCGHDNARAFFRISTSMSRESGFQLRGEIIKYSFLSLHLGLFFENNPLYEDIRKSMLWGHPKVHPNVALNRMFNGTDIMIVEGLCSPSEGVGPGFGAACRAAERMPMGDPVSTAYKICHQANPKQFQALGPDRVYASLTNYSTDPRLKGQQHGFVRDWLICSYHLGFGFDRNPLFSWVPGVLMRDGLSKVGSMLDG